jgi:hypothetical protein
MPICVAVALGSTAKYQLSAAAPTETVPVSSQNARRARELRHRTGWRSMATSTIRYPVDMVTACTIASPSGHRR